MSQLRAAVLEEIGDSGAAAAAGVLTAVDEDEDGEEAPVPDEFGYLTDAEDFE